MGVKSKRGGSSLPLGILVSGFLSSSKKVWVMASMAVNRTVGVYSNNLPIKFSDSGVVALDLKTFIACKTAD